MKGIAKRGGGEGRTGVESELTPSQQKAMTSVLPKAEFVVAGDILLGMRIRKTPEEIALTQVAIDYHDKTLAFARNLIAGKGLGMYDSAVRRATRSTPKGWCSPTIRPPDGHTTPSASTWASARCALASRPPTRTRTNTSTKGSSLAMRFRSPA